MLLEVKSLTPEAVLGMSDEEADAAFMKVRWAATEGRPACPRCEKTDVYRYAAARRFRCAECSYQFTPLTGTIFASGKMPTRIYLLVLALAAQGSNAFRLSHEVGVQYKTAWRLATRIRGMLETPQATSPQTVIKRKRANYYLVCKNCGSNFLDKRGEKTSDLKTGRTKHAFCCRPCYGQYRAAQRADERCRRCNKSKKEISPGWWREMGVTGVIFSNGYCQPCYRLLIAFNGDADLCELHEINQQLKKETINDIDRKKHRRSADAST